MTLKQKFITEGMTSEDALHALHDRKVSAIVWSATPEYMARSERMKQEGTGTILYMTCKHPEGEWSAS